MANGPFHRGFSDPPPVAFVRKPIVALAVTLSPALLARSEPGPALPRAVRELPVEVVR